MAPRGERAIRIGPLTRAHRARVRDIVESTGVFRPAEIDVALEVFDAAFRLGQEDYSLVGAFGPEDALMGFACFGPTPGTVKSWDLYWLAVARDAQKQGVGSALWGAVEHELRCRAARLCVAETSGHPASEGARRFYVHHGFDLAARVQDFYDDGDDRVTYVKLIASVSTPGRTS
jgi:ribosomal protein S18 acetylase RimI-like enzyme